MSWCNQAGISDGAFVHLVGIHTLHMIGCTQAGISDAAFAHLQGIHTLDMRGCRQAGISDAAFAHLVGIHTLNMSWCTWPGEKIVVPTVSGTSVESSPESAEEGPEYGAGQWAPRGSSAERPASPPSGALVGPVTASHKFSSAQAYQI